MFSVNVGQYPGGKVTHVCSDAKVEHTRAEHTDPSVTTQTQINDEQQEYKPPEGPSGP